MVRTRVYGYKAKQRGLGDNRFTLPEKDQIKDEKNETKITSEKDAVVVDTSGPDDSGVEEAAQVETSEESEVEEREDDTVSEQEEEVQDTEEEEDAVEEPQEELEEENVDDTDEVDKEEAPEEDET